MNKLSHFVGQAITAMNVIAAACLAVVTALVFFTVVMRYVFQLPVPGSYDIGRMLMGITVFWGIAVAAWRGRHISVGFVAEMLPPATRFWTTLLGNAAFLGYAALIGWALYKETWSVFGSGQQLFEVGFPLWPFYVVALGGALATVLVLAIRLFTPDPA